MPYKWTHTGENENLSCLQLWPHSSLPSGGFVGFIAVTFALILLPLFPLLGTAVLWGVLPFLMVTVAAIWLALKRSYHDHNILETLSLEANDVLVAKPWRRHFLNEYKSVGTYYNDHSHCWGNDVINGRTCPGSMPRSPVPVPDQSVSA